MSAPRATVGALAVALLSVPAAAAQTPALELSGPRTVATGVGFEVQGTGATAGTRVTIEIALKGRWRALARAAVDERGRFERRVRPPRLMASLRSGPSPAPRARRASLRSGPSPAPRARQSSRSSRSLARSSHSRSSDLDDFAHTGIARSEADRLGASCKPTG